MDDARLRDIIAELPSADDFGDAVLRVQRYGEHDGDEGYLIGNRAALLRFARACLEAAAAPPHPAREHQMHDAAYLPEAEIVATASLFDRQSQLSLTGVSREEPLQRDDYPQGPLPPRGLLARVAPPLAALGCLAFFAFAVIGVATFVGWAAR